MPRTNAQRTGTQKPAAQTTDQLPSPAPSRLIRVDAENTGRPAARTTAPSDPDPALLRKQQREGTGAPELAPVRLVRSAELAYNEGGWSSLDALKRLQARGDGHPDQVHAMREESSADLVALLAGSWSDSDVVGGRAYIMGRQWLLLWDHSQDRASRMLRPRIRRSIFKLESGGSTGARISTCLSVRLISTRVSSSAKARTVCVRSTIKSGAGSRKLNVRAKVPGLRVTCPKCLGHFVTHRIGADKRLLEPAKRSAAGCNNVASGAGG